MKWVVPITLLLVSASSASHAADALRPSPASSVRERYEYGQFAEVETLAQSLLDAGSLTPPQLVELHLYAALAAFNLKNGVLADRHFTALLRIDPDYALDPFLAPPSAMRRFEAVRNSLAGELDEVRVARKAAARAAEAQREEAARRALLDAQTQRAVSAPRPSAPNLWVNFVPFGAGQFQQGRIGAGVAFAISEVLLAATSLITYFTYNGLFQSTLITVNNQPLGGTGQVQISGIPRAQQRTAELLRGFNLASGIGAYTVYAGGVLEAMLRQREQQTPPTSPAPPPSVSVSIGAMGAGVQVSLRF